MLPGLALDTILKVDNGLNEVLRKRKQKVRHRKGYEEHLIRTSLVLPSNRSQTSLGIRLGPWCCGVGVVSRPRTTRGPEGGFPGVGDVPDAPDPLLWVREWPKGCVPLKLSTDSRLETLGTSSFSRKPDKYKAILKSYPDLIRVSPVNKTFRIFNYQS